METSFYFGKGLNIMKELICLIGPSGGGKSTVSKILSESYHYTLANTTFFVKDLKKSGGKYFISNGLVTKIDEYKKRILLDSGEKINIENIYDIQIE